MVDQDQVVLRDCSDTAILLYLIYMAQNLSLAWLQAFAIFLIEIPIGKMFDLTDLRTS